MLGRFESNRILAYDKDRFARLRIHTFFILSPPDAETAEAADQYSLTPGKSILNNLKYQVHNFQGIRVGYSPVGLIDSPAYIIFIHNL